MFERFTDRARRVVVLAQEEARMLNHDHIGTEHLLLGLVHEGEGVAAKVLETLGISPEALRQRVEEAIGHGQEAPAGHVPFTPGAKKAMELALREAKDLGHTYIGTEHLLLGLIAEAEGVAARTLAELGAGEAAVRQQMTQLLYGWGGGGMSSYGPRRRKRGRAALAEDTLAQVTALEQRLDAIERWVGLTPDTSGIEVQIADVRRAKEAAIDSQDFETAAALRDQEKNLLTRKASQQEKWATGDAPAPLAREVARLAAEVDRLRAMVHRDDPEPGTSTEPGTGTG